MGWNINSFQSIIDLLILASLVLVSLSFPISRQVNAVGYRLLHLPLLTYMQGTRCREYYVGLSSDDHVDATIPTSLN